MTDAQDGSNITGTDFFKTIIAKHSLAHVILQRTPLRSQHIFFQRSGSILMPFPKKRLVVGDVSTPRTVWMTTFRPLKFTADPNNSMGKRVSHGPVCLSGVSASERAESAWRMNRMIVGQRRRHPDCSGEWIRRQPHAFSEKDIRMLPERWKKMCWLRRGVRWRLTCASECLAIMVLTKISPGHIWTTLYIRRWERTIALTF